MQTLLMLNDCNVPTGGASSHKENCGTKQRESNCIVNVDKKSKPLDVEMQCGAA